MNDLNLTNLTLQIETLLRSYEQCQQENSFLRQKLAKLSHERAELIDKNKKAAAKIKRIITQLRSEML